MRGLLRELGAPEASHHKFVYWCFGVNWQNATVGIDAVSMLESLKALLERSIPASQRVALLLHVLDAFMMQGV